MESTSYVYLFRRVFFYLVTTGWIFYISLCENSINQHTYLAVRTHVLVVVVVVVVFTLKTVLTSIQYPSLSYSSRQRNEFPWSHANPK